MMKVEDGSWLVTLAGLGGEQPPLEPAGFAAFAATLASDDIHRAVARGQALDAPSAFRFPASVRHRYERLADFPERLLAAGDAVCSFNPVYGQGVTVAALEAAILRHQLGDAGVPTADRWFAALTPVVDGAWNMAVGADLALECVEGHRSLSTRLLNRYMMSLHAAAAHDPTLSEQFLRVTGLFDPPSALLRPAAVARVLRGKLRGSPRCIRGGHGRRAITTAPSVASLDSLVPAWRGPPPEGDCIGSDSQDYAFGHVTVSLQRTTLRPRLVNPSRIDDGPGSGSHQPTCTRSRDRP